MDFLTEDALINFSIPRFIVFIFFEFTVVTYLNEDFVGVNP